MHAANVKMVLNMNNKNTGKTVREFFLVKTGLNSNDTIKILLIQHSNSVYVCEGVREMYCIYIYVIDGGLVGEKYKRNMKQIGVHKMDIPVQNHVDRLV